MDDWTSMVPCTVCFTDQRLSWNGSQWLVCPCIQDWGKVLVVPRRARPARQSHGSCNL